MAFLDVAINGGDPDWSSAGVAVDTQHSYNKHMYFEPPWVRYEGEEYVEDYMTGVGYSLSAVPAEGFKFLRWRSMAASWSHRQFITPVSSDTETSSIVVIGETSSYYEQGVRTRGAYTVAGVGYTAADVAGWDYVTDDPTILPYWTGPAPDGGFGSPQYICLLQEHTRVEQTIMTPGLSGYETANIWTWTPLSVNLEFAKSNITIRFYGKRLGGGPDVLASTMPNQKWDGRNGLSADPVFFGGYGLHHSVYSIDMQNYLSAEIAETQGWKTNNGYVLQEGTNHWLPQPGTQLANGLYTPTGTGDYYMDLHANYRNCKHKLLRRSGGQLFSFTDSSGNKRLLQDDQPCHGFSE